MTKCCTRMDLRPARIVCWPFELAAQICVQCGDIQTDLPPLQEWWARLTWNGKVSIADSVAKELIENTGEVIE